MRPLQQAVETTCKDLRQGNPTRDFFKGIDGPGKTLPRKRRQVRLGRARRVNAQELLSPGSEKLKIARRFDNNELGLRNIHTQVRVEQRVVDHKAAIIEQR